MTLVLEPHVLIADESTAARGDLLSAMAARGWRISLAADPMDAVRSLVAAPPDALLIDLETSWPQFSQRFEELRAEGRCTEVPVVVTAFCTDPEAVEGALRRGAQDFVRRPVDAGELITRLATAVHGRREIGALRRMALVDFLTGLYNRRHLLAEMAALLASARRRGDVFSAVLLDVDGFKKVNDEHGHATGDEVLQAIARRLSEAVRVEDVVGRWGGEEFLVLMPRTDDEGAVLAANRMLQALRAATVPTGVGPISMTASAGVATYTAADEVAAILARADEALYAAKEGGRDRVIAAQ